MSSARDRLWLELLALPEGDHRAMAWAMGRWSSGDSFSPAVRRVFGALVAVLDEAAVNGRFLDQVVTELADPLEDV